MPNEELKARIRERIEKMRNPVKEEHPRIEKIGNVWLVHGFDRYKEEPEQKLKGKFKWQNQSH